jgi:uncharacterized membrane protein
MAVLALLGILDSVYLLLAKLGYIGSLSCSVSHGCDLVNASVYSSFAGVPVAGIGLVGYVVLLAIAVAGLQPTWLEARWPDTTLAVLSGVGLLFSLRLTYYELFALNAICQWCVVSQLAILLIFVFSLAGVFRREAADSRCPISDQRRS